LKILLDENLDWRLERDLGEHVVLSVPRIGWAGITNGELIRRAEEQFDALITMDIGLVNQQNLAGRNVIVILLRAKSNRLSDTRPLMPDVVVALEIAQPGTITSIPK
jgi:predicted nuclease of predicted toxin-antitoxin system